jgi:hypothetical protein
MIPGRSGENDIHVKNCDTFKNNIIPAKRNILYLCLQDLGKKRANQAVSKLF